MPQVWLTYSELGEFLDIDRDDIREIAINCGMPRRRCTDGQTRVKLLPDHTGDYIIGYAARLTPKAITHIRKPEPTATKDRQFDRESVAELLDAAQTAGIDVTAILSSLLKDVAQKARRRPVSSDADQIIDHDHIAM
jgi:hypothetical protein